MRVHWSPTLVEAPRRAAFVVKGDYSSKSLPKVEDIMGDWPPLGNFVKRPETTCGPSSEAALQEVRLRAHCARLRATTTRPSSSRVTPIDLARGSMLSRSASLEAASGGLRSFRAVSARPTKTPPRRCGNFLVLTPPQRGSLSARGKQLMPFVTEQAHRAFLRYEIRCDAVAAVSVLLSLDLRNRNRGPGHGRILELAGHLRATAAENPDPSVLSRTQFLKIATAVIAGLEKHTANALFSSFDTRHLDRVRVGPMATALMAGHRSEATTMDHLLRNALEAYDPENKGIQHDELNELLRCFATSQDDDLTMGRLIAQLPLRRDKRDTHLIAALRQAPALRAELQKQLDAFRAKVRASHLRQLNARHHALARTNDASYALSASS